MQLFLLPYAGGDVNSFKNLTTFLDKRIQVITVEYPGRGRRAREKFVEDFEKLVEDVAEYINSRRDENMPYAVLGYSMGSIIAYEIASAGRISGELKHVFFCAENSPMDKRDGHLGINATDESVIQRLAEFGGINKKLLQNKRFFDIYMRPSIEDFKLLKQHECIIGETKIQCSATIIYSEADTPYNEVERWAELINGKTEFYEMGDNHFFINQNSEKIAKILNETLEEYIVD